MSRFDAKWDWLLNDATLPAMARELAKAASARAALRALYPYTSLERTLRFSRVDEWPYSEDMPRIRCIDPEYELEGPAYEVRDADGRPERFSDLQLALDSVTKLLLRPQGNDPVRL